MEKKSKSNKYESRAKRGAGKHSEMDKDDFFSRIESLGYDYKGFANVAGVSEATVRGWRRKPIPLIVERVLFLLERAANTKLLLETNYQFDNAVTKPKRVRGTKI